jgi:uncharacterized repeat protein (TIGR01451 family)
MHVGTTGRRTILSLGLAGLLVGLAAAPAAAGNGAGAPSQRGVQPVVRDTGSANPLNECRTLTGLQDVDAFQIAGEGGGFPGGSPYSDGTLTVTISDWKPQAKSFDWDSNRPLLGVWVKGGSGGEGNWYDYSGFADQPPSVGADHDGDLHPKDNPNGVAGLSHVTFCYGDLTLPPGSPDIEVSKDSDASGPVQGGDTIRYTIGVRNVGDATAHDVVVNDDLPAGVHPVGGVPGLQGADGFCAATGSVGPDGVEHFSIYCEIDELEAGDAATITAAVEVDDDAPCGELTNVVHAEAGDEPDGAVDGGNDAQVTDEVACACDVDIAKTADPASGNPGDEITYTYVVTNTGTAGLVDLEVTDDQLGDVGQVAALAPGQDATLEATSTLPTTGSAVVNVGTVVGYTTDGERCRASDDAVVTVVSGGGGGNPPGEGPDGDGGGGTAFTGPADLPLGVAMVLLVAGLVTLAATRRRDPEGGRG